MAVVTLRPNSTDAVVNFTIFGGAATHHGAVSDDSDATGSYSPFLGQLEVGIPAITVPVGAKIKQCRINFRARADATCSFYVNFVRRAPSFGQTPVTSHVISNTALQTFLGPWQATDPYGNPWTPAGVDASAVNLRPWTDGVRLDVSEVYIDVEYNERPTITVTGPAEGATIATARPTYTWTFSDPENDPQEKYRLKIFTAAQYGAEGFDPATSAAAYDSGDVFSGGTQVTPDYSLANATTYRVYVRAGQPAVSGQELLSLWDYNQFSTSYPAPDAPTVTGPTAVT